MSNSTLCRSNNILELESGGSQFMSCMFDLPDGVYYDAIGEEIFTVRRLDVPKQMTKIYYEVEFEGLKITTSTLTDHGFNERLGDL